MSFFIGATGKPEDVQRHVAEEMTRQAGFPHNKRAASVLSNAGMVVEEAARLIEGGVHYRISGHFDDAGNGSIDIHVSRAQLAEPALVERPKIGRVDSSPPADDVTKPEEG